MKVKLVIFLLNILALKYIKCQNIISYSAKNCHCLNRILEDFITINNWTSITLLFNKNKGKYFI